MLYLRQHNVVNTKCRSRCYVDRFLAIGSEIKGDSALPLCFIEDVIHDMEGDHLPVHFQSHLLIDLTSVSNINLQNKSLSHSMSQGILKMVQ